jgi:hypothetical protein
MEMVKYQQEAQRTKSPEFHGDKVSRAIFIQRMLAFMDAAKKLDEVKKALFYNKPFDGLVNDGVVELSSFTFDFHNMAVEGQQQTALDILHCIIGKATESGELVELAMNCLCGNRQFDAVNFVEELGDGFWYDAIGLEAVRATFADATGSNNAKLRTRFPHKFTEAAAINRDLAAERQTLENSGK